ncbi:MAG TPA: ATP-binding cassette domain-containing protein [Candidatus Competibacteraceae bacterium]|nr:ATP-binding cassette domain-containing protein [Candidatus Competibacteraceae bacterium]
MPQAVVEVSGLVKRYGERNVVDGVDLTIEPGECFGLLGPNGAGKTTTLRMLLGLTPPSGGQIRVLGHPIPAEARIMRTRVGVVPQFDNLDPDFTVRENLATYGSYFGLRGRELERRIEQLLEFAQLADRGDAPIQTLSGGMKRRLTLARALINRPELLVLDEPTTGLDPQARQHIWERLRRLLGDGRSLILTTHYMEEAERLCDRIAIIDHGRVQACDSPRGLIRTHIEPHVVELHGAVDPTWLAGAQSASGVRLERVGETVFLYGFEREPLLALADAAGTEYLYRPANLEDVFLKLTGRELRD